MDNNSSKKAFKSLALVKIQWDRDRSVYLDNFLPFLATLFVRKKYKCIEENQTSINMLISDFKDEFGLNIPYFPMISIINRARRKMLIEKEEHNFFPTAEIYKQDFTNKIQELVTKYEKIIEEYIKFSKEKYNRELNEADAEQTLICFLKQHDLEILFATYERSPLPDVVSTKENLFIFNKFIQNIFTNNYQLFLLFLDLVIGHILTDAIFYEEKLKNFLEPQLRNLNLYLDTKLIFRLTGIEGDEIKNVYKLLLQELKTQGIKVCVFSHTYEEIKGILQGCLSWIESPNYNTLQASLVSRFLKSQGYRESDVQLFINSMDKILEENNIQKIEPPNYNDYKDYIIEEKTLEGYIIQTYKDNAPEFIYEKKDYTISKDIRSISSVYMLRKKQKPVNIKQANHIFVTINSALAYATKKFEKDIEYKEGFYIPACVTDTFIGTLIWMRNPNKVIEINEKKIVADIYAALQPNEELLKRYIAELNKLNGKITEDEYILLRDSFVARELLGEVTLGDPQNFTTKTPFEILNIMNSEAYKHYNQEKNEHEKTKEQLIQEREKDNKRIENYKLKAGKIAKILGAILIIIFILSSVGAWFKIEGKFKFILMIVFLIFTTASFLGITIPKINKKFQDFILNKIYGIQNDKYNAQ